MKVVSEWRPSYCPKDLSRTLIIIPCSGAKTGRPKRYEWRFNAMERWDGARLQLSTRLSYSVSASLEEEYRLAQDRVAQQIYIDESRALPAIERYNGSLYRIARPALYNLMDAGVRIVILSAAYGAVLATEDIGYYNQVLKPSWWPKRIIERLLVAYAQYHRIKSVRGFCSATGPYRTILGRVPWAEASVEDVLLFTPPVSTGNLVKSPREQGHALVAWSLTIGT